MKNFSILLFVGSTLLFSCGKTCTSDVPACTERPESGTVCQASFSSWFYDEGTGTCAIINYTGCEELGFSTQIECENCDCR